MIQSIQYPGRIQAISVSQLGNIAIIDASGGISVFDSNRLLLTRSHGLFERTQRDALAFSPDGETLAIMISVYGFGTLKLLSLKPDRLDSQLCTKLLAEPLRETWRTILPNDSPPPPCTPKTRIGLGRPPVSP
jgi:hypothetical protein